MWLVAQALCGATAPRLPPANVGTEEPWYYRRSATGPFTAQRPVTASFRQPFTHRLARAVASLRREQSLQLRQNPSSAAAVWKQYRRTALSPRSMPSAHDRLPKEPERAMSFAFPLSLYRHVEAQARRYGMSRSSFVRMLVARDLEAVQVAQRSQAS